MYLTLEWNIDWVCLTYKLSRENVILMRKKNAKCLIQFPSFSYLWFPDVYDLYPFLMAMSKKLSSWIVVY